MANREGDRRRQPTPHMGSVTQRPAHDFSRAVRADGRGVNDAHGETHRTRFLLSCAVLVNTLRPPCGATLTQVNRAPWHRRCGWKDAGNGRKLAPSRGSSWPRIAAVGKRGSCREGQRTDAVAHSHYRPRPAARDDVLIPVSKLRWIVRFPAGNMVHTSTALGQLQPFTAYTIHVGNGRSQGGKGVHAYAGAVAGLP